MEKQSFRVIIVGGSLSGLVLAHCLQRAGIDHLVLERGDEIAPELGASIGTTPNGARVLDQLGLYEKLEKCTEPLKVMQMTFPDGFAVASAVPQILRERYNLGPPRKELLFPS